MAGCLQDIAPSPLAEISIARMGIDAEQADRGLFSMSASAAGSLQRGPSSKAGDEGRSSGAL